MRLPCQARGLRPAKKRDLIDWPYHLPVFWMALVVFAATFFVTGLICLSVLTLAKEGRTRIFKAMSPVMLTSLAVVFGLLVGFLSAQVGAMPIGPTPR